MGIPSNKFRQCAAVILTVVVSLFVLASAYEIYLRKKGFMASLPPSYPCVAPHLTLNHVFRGNCRGEVNPETLRVPEAKIWQTNSEGWRMPEINSSQKSILLMGDSYVEGFGLSNSENLPSKLQNELRNWQIINAGVMGYANALYPRIWEEKFIKYKNIRYVLVNLDFSDFNENLYYTSISKGAESDSRNYLDILERLFFPATETWPRWTMPLVYSNYSALLRLFHQETNRYLVADKAKKQQGLIGDLLSGNALLSQEQLQKRKMQNCWAGMELSLRYLQLLKMKLDREGVGMGVHMYPTGAQVRAYPKKKFAVSFVESLDLGETSKLKCEHSLGAVDILQKPIRALGIDFYDGRMAIMNAKDRELLYFPDDAHWNSRGTEVAAKALAPLLIKRLSKNGDRN